MDGERIPCAPAPRGHALYKPGTWSLSSTEWDVSPKTQERLREARSRREEMMEQKRQEEFWIRKRMQDEADQNKAFLMQERMGAFCMQDIEYEMEAIFRHREVPSPSPDPEKVRAFKRQRYGYDTVDFEDEFCEPLSDTLPLSDAFTWNELTENDEKKSEKFNDEAEVPGAGQQEIEYVGLSLSQKLMPKQLGDTIPLPQRRPAEVSDAGDRQEAQHKQNLLVDNDS